jgi:hypothetical protein
MTPDAWPSSKQEEVAGYLCLCPQELSLLRELLTASGRGQQPAEQRLALKLVDFANWDPRRWRIIDLTHEELAILADVLFEAHLRSDPRGQTIERRLDAMMRLRLEE